MSKKLNEYTIKVQPYGFAYHQLRGYAITREIRIVRSNLSNNELWVFTVKSKHTREELGI